MCDMGAVRFPEGILCMFFFAIFKFSSIWTCGGARFDHIALSGSPATAGGGGGIPLQAKKIAAAVPCVGF